MKFLTFLAAFLLLFQNQASAQNEILLSSSDDISLNKDYSTLVNKRLNELLDVNELLKGALNSFKRDHISYGYVVFHYCMLPTSGNYSNLYSTMKRNEEEGIDWEVLLTEIKSEFFKNKQLYEALYRAVMPLYQEAFAKMSVDEQEAYLQELSNALTFAQNFNLEKEKADEAKPDFSYAHEKGKFNAFIYRRIRNGELNKTECEQWIKRIFDDLKAFAKKNPKEEDHWIIDSHVAGNFYKAYRFKDAYDYEKHEILFKEGDKYFTLKSKGIEVIAKGSGLDQPIDYIQVAYKDGSSELHIFNGEESYARIKTEARIREIIRKNMFLIAIYEDNRAELISRPADANKIERIKLSKTVSSLPSIIYRSFGACNYTDGSSELFYASSESQIQRISFNSAISQASAEQHIIILGFADGKKSLLEFEDNSFKQIILPSDYEVSPDLFTSFGDYIIFGVSITADHPEEDFDDIYTQYRFGIIDRQGSLLLKPIYNQIRPLGNFPSSLLVTDTFNKMAVFDAQFKPLTAFVYDCSVQSYFDWETAESYNRLEDAPDAKDATLILANNTKAKATKQVMYDINGKILIPEKWPYIKRLLTAEGEAHNFYLVAAKAGYKVEDWVPKSKLAIFDYQGKQLTGFQFDDVTGFSEGVFNCVLKGKVVRVNQAGKIVP